MPRISNTLRQRFSIEALARIREHPASQEFFRDVSAQKGELSLLQAVSAAFGLDEGNDAKRIEITRREIFPLLLHPSHPLKNSEFDKFCKLLPKYKGCTASGSHRFMPLGMAVNNILNERNIFSVELISSMPEDVKKYMLKEHPLHGNPLGLPQDFLPAYIPELRIEVPHKKEYSWLDIGSAPKSEGAPTLNILRDMLPQNFRYFGSDIVIPRYEIAGEKIIDSKYVNPDGSFKDSTNVNGITYINAKKTEHDIASEDFLKDSSFDFISICMTLHHFWPKSSHGVRTAFTSLPILDSKGHPFTRDAVIKGTSEQRFVVDNLLRHLALGGILFLDAHPMSTSIIDEQSVIKESLYDMFFVIQKTGSNLFRIHENAPILFVPNRQLYSPSGEYRFIRGWDMENPAFAHKGISSYININETDEQKLSMFFSRADALATRYQSWKKGIYGKVHLVLDGIRNREPISKLFSDYLSNVPDTGCHDAELKEMLLADVKQFEDELK